jgi:GNAT superfamily N-acetyltransferase
MPIYPERYERRVDLRDGSRVLLRPIRGTDEPALREMFYALSEETVYHRFFRPLPTMPHRQLQEWLRVDYVSQMVLVASEGVEGDESIVAVARYDLDRRANLAEVAFVVRDDHQGRGLGTLMLEALIEVARENGIAGFTAVVQADNVRMVRVFHKVAPALESRLVDGTYEIAIRFEAGMGTVASEGPEATD